MYYRFAIDGRGAGPWRDEWEQAAQDAVNAGCALWVRGGVKLDDSAGAEIERVRSIPSTPPAVVPPPDTTPTELRFFPVEEHRRAFVAGKLARMAVALIAALLLYALVG